MEIQCDACGARQIVPEAQERRFRKCGKCSYLISVPGLNEESETQSAGQLTAVTQATANQNVVKQAAGPKVAKPVPPPPPIPAIPPVQSPLPPLPATPQAVIGEYQPTPSQPQPMNDETGDASGTMSCPSCKTSGIPKDKCWCPVCKYNFITQSIPKPPAQGSLIGAVIGAIIGAGLGAFIWAWICHAAECEINAISIIVGLFAGAGVVIGGKEKSFTMGLVALVIGVIGIFAGSYAGYRWVMSSPNVHNSARMMIRHQATERYRAAEIQDALPQIIAASLSGVSPEAIHEEAEKRAAKKVESYMASEEFQRDFAEATSYGNFVFRNLFAIFFFLLCGSIGVYGGYRFAAGGKKKPDLFT